ETYEKLHYVLSRFGLAAEHVPDMPEGVEVHYA
ncbi:MAG: hypothetical protein JWP22_3205, partial [Ramlibacter sp.]|nr:hypothetical protein [Ramlibacter sp.]